MISFRKDRIRVPDNGPYSASTVDWIVSDGLTPYERAVSAMESRVGRIARGKAAEAIWLVEHPPLYTVGTSADPAELIGPSRFPVYPSGRGGRYTYHGPGQRVVYTMLNVGARGRDARRFIAQLEDWAIATLEEFNVRGERREGRPGVWTVRSDRPAEAKIAAVGVRLRKWVSFHGFSINVEPELTHFGGIVPCGVREYGVTSLADLGLPVTMADLDVALQRTFGQVFKSPLRPSSLPEQESRALRCPDPDPAPWPSE